MSLVCLDYLLQVLKKVTSMIRAGTEVVLGLGLLYWFDDYIYRLELRPIRYHVGKATHKC